MKLCCERYAFWITLGVSLCAYFNTVSPSIAGGDAGELVAEGCQLGVSHPPGYPLYTIMVHFVTKYVRRIVPNDRSDAWIVNSTSCIFGSVASALLASSIVLLLQGKQGRSFEKVQSKRSTPKYNAPALTTKRVMGVNDLIHVVAGTSMGLLHSFSPLAWQYSITSEVFALHNLFVALILYASICFAQEQSLKYFLLALKIDPNYAAAYAGIASVGAAKMQNGVVRGIEVIPKLDSLMSKALELDNSLPEVYFTIALWNTWGKWDWKNAGMAFKKALSLNPNHAATRAYYSHYLLMTLQPISFL